jgi:general secretion pathway protein D
MLPLTVCQAAPLAPLWHVAAGSAGQFGGSNDKSAQSQKLLSQASKAIKQGDYTQAETLITQAEKLGVKYNALTERFVDTPDKMRKLLAEERSKTAAKRPPARPDRTNPRPPSIPADPVHTPGQSPDQQQGKDPAEQIVQDKKSLAVTFLKDARAALSRGDKFAALGAWQKAAALKADFAPDEFSPQTVADELVKAGIDPSRLVPAAAGPAGPSSPYMLRPTDVNTSGEFVPQLAGSGQVPAAAAPTASPNNLPAEINPLAIGARPADGPAPGQAPAPGAPTAPQPLPVPQRLPVGDAGAKTQAAKLIAEARVALDKGDLQTASQLAEQAEALNVPDDAFAAGETRPWQMVLEISRAMYRREGVVQAGGTAAVAAGPEPRYPVAQGLYDPNNDKTRTIPANSEASILARTQTAAQPTPGLPPVTSQPAAGQAVTREGGPGQQLYEEGLQALQNQDRETALKKFADAWRFESELDPELRQQLKDKLTFLRAATSQPSAGPAAPGGQQSPLEQVHSQQDLLRQKLSRELANEEKMAKDLAQTDPRQALMNLKKFRDRVSGSQIDAAAKKYLLTMVDQRIHELTVYIEQNKATIENTEKNNAVKAEVIRKQELTNETQNKLADMVEQFNKLMDDKRFAEAEVLARQARDVAPEEPVVVNMLEKAKLARAIAEDMSIKERSESGFLSALQSVGESGVPFDDRNPILFGNAKRWGDLTRSRARMLAQQTKLSPIEMEIQKSLSKAVEVKFSNRPLSEVMDTLGRMAGVNVYLDPQGMHAEGVTTDTPVTLNLTQPISLKSALNLLLSPLGLSYVVQNEVLRITSEQTRNANTYARVYYVADLVMPIPNFVPSYNLGLPGAIRESLNSMGFGMTPRAMAGPLTLAKNEGQQPSMQTSTEVLAQINQMGTPNAAAQPPGARAPNMTAGPGGLGGGVVADFDSLIDLITTTISPQSWDDVGGPGSIEGFQTNLSLVVSQTQDVHEQIADLLEQLRRLQDLQVTIEVRFITLADNFFERIGVDFDFAIDDNTGLNNRFDLLPTGPGTGDQLFDDRTPSVSIGFTATGPTADLDIPFTQGSFGSSTPQFGNFDANTAANFGFAILSDIEVFFLLSAAQGDTRTNILQAPKVTLFNGQQAFVSDTTQRPFVTSVIPVVGDFAAAQMPVIVVLNEGTSMSVQAVVSADRRFVRLTMVPFFSQIGQVDEFTFTGSTTTDSGTTVQDPSNPDQNVTNGVTRTVSGTTVQLPTFAFTTVTTTVSVPDGGTVLLGGIKRLREGRTEKGVPLLSKVPWVSRLFKNVGIGREAQSLMMMVTPRIIIQEEEEEKLGIEIANSPSDTFRR